MAAPTAVASTRSGLGDYLREALSREWSLPLLCACAYLVFALASIDRSTYWLHFDTPTQPVEALGRFNNWAYAGNKVIPMYLLRGLYFILGPSPQVETVLFVVLGMVGAASLAMFAEKALASRRWAALVVLIYLSLPLVGYYMRMHLAYPLAFFLVGLALYAHERFAWANLSFAFAVLSHMSFSVPVVVWLLTSTLMGLRPRTWQHIALWVLTPLGVYLATEVLARYHTGVWFYWLRASRGEVNKWITNEMLIDYRHLWFTLWLGNGLPRALFLMLGWLYPLFWEKSNRVLNAAFLLTAIVAGYYQYRAAMHIFVIGRLLAGLYAPAVILSLVVVRGFLRRLAQSPGTARASRLAWRLAILMLVPLSLFDSLFELARYTRTAFPLIDEAMHRGKAENRPVYCFCNNWIPWYYNSALGVEAPSPDFIPPYTMPLPEDASAILAFVPEADEQALQGIVRHWIERGFVASQAEGERVLARYEKYRTQIPYYVYPLDKLEQVSSTPALQALIGFRRAEPEMPWAAVWYPPPDWP